MYSESATIPCPPIKRWMDEWGIIVAFIVIKLLAHFLTSANYELHRDSFLYIEQGKHPAWGYATTPTFIGIIAGLSRFLFGGSDFGIGFFPALAGAASILLIGIIVKELGGRNMAVIIACLAYLIMIGEDDNLFNLYNQVEVFGRITTQHARQEGTPVYLCRYPRLDIDSFYRAELAAIRRNQD